MANVLIEESTMTAIGNAIRAKTGKSDLILPANMATEIGSITGGGGESTDLVKYVTFLAEDGSELYKMPVLNGDDCKDPVSHGDIEAPTKESTNTTHYTYSGWTSEVGGTADSSILQNITADKTVYVAFATSIRYYTVTFYDGSTVLKTVKASYGADVSDYAPYKDGYIFNSWDPSPTNVTADMDCYAVWDEGITFAKSSWSQIASVCEAGDAANYFKVGDQRAITFTNGISYTAEIMGINHDDLADGSGKAGISVRIIGSAVSSGLSVGNSYGNWSTVKLRTQYYANTFPYKLEKELRDVVKSVTKKSYYSGQIYTTSDKYWNISSAELGYKNYAEGTRYELFPTADKDITKNTKYEEIATGYNYIMRTCPQGNYIRVVTSDGGHAQTSTLYGNMPCFCI